MHTWGTPEWPVKIWSALEFFLSAAVSSVVGRAAGLTGPSTGGGQALTVLTYSGNREMLTHPRGGGAAEDKLVKSQLL